MGHRFAEIAFTKSVREVQQTMGSRAGYRPMEQGEDHNHVLTAREIEFIAARDSLYMATVSETGWPYVQHRGGPVGFVRVLDEQTIGFADFKGNRQYVSVGNLRRDDRVSLLFMDYPNRARLKLLGRVRLIGDDEGDLLAQLEVPEYRAAVERGFAIQIEAFDWNCPQHITPRFTEAQVDEIIAPVLEENRRLTAQRSEVGATGTLGDGPLELVISGVRQLTPRVRAFELHDPGGTALPAVEAGAHLEVPVRVANGETVTRCYSICSNPARRDIYEIAVLRDDAGDGGSLAVHRSFAIGLRLRCGVPENHFPLHGDGRSAVLIAGGIGITPIKAMAQALKERGNLMRIHYAGRSGGEMAYRDRMQQQFGDELAIYRSANGERLDIERVLATAPGDALIYVCGPARLIEGVLSAARARNIDPRRIRFERFTSVPPADAKPVQLELHRSGQRLEVAADQSLLDAMLDAGVDAAYSCRTGTCKTCAVPVLDGEPDHRDSVLSRVERDRDRLMCPCVSRAISDRLVLDV